MTTAKRNLKYLEFAKMELTLEILKIQERYNLNDDETLAIVGNTLLFLGDQDKKMRIPIKETISKEVR